ncbi:hypothetical protein Pla163_04700 [Planctomycetes bacterium Pla163]|uniref:DUF7305 domain-containing protein n=1 Tax=Rohdeia mirabilis TaxID=2528008 RepID=A0A518CVW4_9BACT|nr:hypothetical protein Pla163_04700 [Planctomycetes bacterium Pla163]
MHHSTRRDVATRPRSRFVVSANCAPSRRGSSLALALLLVTAAALVATLTVQRGLQQWQRQEASSAQKQAFYMAEAGLSEAIDALRSGGSGNVGTRETPALFGSGGFWVETVVDDHDVARVTSTGLYDGHAYRLSQAVTRPHLPLADEGFFGRHGVEVGAGTRVEYVASDASQEATPNAGSQAPGVLGGLLGGLGQGIALPQAPSEDATVPAVLGSDGSIALGAGANVAGSALPGPEGSVDLANGSEVSGSLVPERDPRLLPPIALPQVEDREPAVWPAALDLEIEGGARGFEPITVGTGRTLRLVGPLALVTENLAVRPGGRLEVDTTNGAVHVYVERQLAIDFGATVANTTGDPSRFVVLVDGSLGDDLGGDGDADDAVAWADPQSVQLALYAPNSNVHLPDQIHWRGGVVARTLAVGAAAVLELDQRVEDVRIEGRDLVALAWQVVAIPGPERTELARDPLAIARREGRLLPDAAAARVPADDLFAFENEDGETFTYAGASLLDLSLATVGAVLALPADALGAVPVFAAYGADHSKALAPLASQRFDHAWKYALGNLPADWVAALETGAIPPAAWNAVVNQGQLVEPIASVFGDPSVRGDIAAHLSDAGQHPATAQFLLAALDLLP